MIANEFLFSLTKKKSVQRYNIIKFFFLCTHFLVKEFSLFPIEKMLCDCEEIPSWIEMTDKKEITCWILNWAINGYENFLAYNRAAWIIRNSSLRDS